MWCGGLLNQTSFTLAIVWLTRTQKLVVLTSAPLANGVPIKVLWAELMVVNLGSPLSNKYQAHQCDRRKRYVALDIFLDTLWSPFIVSHPLHLHLKWLFSIIHHLDWVSHYLCLVLSLTNPSDSCVKRGLSLSGSLGESHWNAERKSWDLKRLSSRNRSTSPWECTHFHTSPSLRRESITSTMGLQMAVPGHTRLSALEDHSRQHCTEGGQGRVTGQGRTAGGCMSWSQDHTGTLQITIRIVIML